MAWGRYLLSDLNCPSLNPWYSRVCRGSIPFLFILLRLRPDAENLPWGQLPSRRVYYRFYTVFSRP